MIGNVAMGEIKSILVILGGHARVNSDQSRPWGESPVLPLAIPIPTWTLTRSQQISG